MLASMPSELRGMLPMATVAAVLFIGMFGLIERPSRISPPLYGDGDTYVPSKLPSWSLGNGVEYPLVALNTASLSVEETARTIGVGLAMGIKNVDFHLGLEREGVALAVTVLGRENLFLVTKLDKPPATMTDPAEAAALAQKVIDDELGALGSDIDMLLMKDSASCPVMQAQWKVLELAMYAGKTRSLGVYNFCQFSLDCILATARTPPAVNYIMRHVGMGPDATGLIAYNEAHGIKTAAYGTIGEPTALASVLADPTLNAIAAAHGKSPEEVALKWNLQSGYAVSNRLTADYAPSNPKPGSFCTKHCEVGIKGMAEAFTWELTADEMAALDAIVIDDYPQSPTYYSSSGCPASFGVSAHPTESVCPGGSAWC